MKLVSMIAMTGMAALSLAGCENAAQPTDASTKSDLPGLDAEAAGSPIVGRILEYSADKEGISFLVKDVFCEDITVKVDRKTRPATVSLLSEVYDDPNCHMADVARKEVTYKFSWDEIDLKHGEKSVVTNPIR